MKFNKNIFCTTALCLITFGVNAIEVTANRGRDTNITGPLQIQIEKLNIALQRTNARLEQIENCSETGFFYSVSEGKCVEVPKVEIKHGVHFAKDGTHAYRGYQGEEKITFDTPFKEVPKIMTSIQQTSMYGPARKDIFAPTAYAINISKTGFTLRIGGGGYDYFEREYKGMQIGWIAFTGDTGSGTYNAPPPPPPPPPSPTFSSTSSDCGRGGDQCINSSSSEGRN